jgi:hypothetical protein
LLVSIKEKPLHVFLLKGYVSNNQVKAERCENCKAMSEVLTINHSNPNLLLFGCKDNKCKNKILRLNHEDNLV